MSNFASFFTDSFLAFKDDGPMTLVPLYLGGTQPVNTGMKQEASTTSITWDRRFRWNFREGSPLPCC